MAHPLSRATPTAAPDRFADVRHPADPDNQEGVRLAYRLLGPAPSASPDTTPLVLLMGFRYSAPSLHMSTWYGGTY